MQLIFACMSNFISFFFFGHKMFLRSIPTEVVIRGVIPITVKMAP